MSAAEAMDALDAARPSWSRVVERGGSLVRPVAVEDLAEALAPWRGRQVYLASPVTRFVEAGNAGIAAARALPWALDLTAMSLSVVAPAMLASGLDVHPGPLGEFLRRADHWWWMGRCFPLLDASAAMVVPPIEGWDVSRGVLMEAGRAVDKQKPVYLIREGA